MNRQQFYQRQQITPEDFNDILQINIENADRNIIKDAIGDGILEGLEVAENSHSKVTVKAGVAYKNGNRIALTADSQVDLSSYMPETNSKYITIGIKFARKEYDDKTNGLGNKIKYRSDEHFEVVILQGIESESPSTPAIASDLIVIADVLLSQNNLTIDISRVTRLFNNLKLIDLSNKVESESKKISDIVENEAAINITLSDEAATTTLPTITKTSVKSILQAIRNNLKELFNKTFIINVVHPVGCFRIQFPGEASPTDLYGGIWGLRFNTEGIFFRTEGGTASNFESGIQESSIKNHKHNGTTGYMGTNQTHSHTGSSGAQFFMGTGGGWSISSGGSNGFANSTASANIDHTHTFTTNDNIGGGADTWSRNRTIRVWEKIA